MCSDCVLTVHFQVLNSVCVPPFRIDRIPFDDGATKTITINQSSTVKQSAEEEEEEVKKQESKENS